MKKLSLLLIIILCISIYSSAQQNWSKYSESYPSSFNNDSTKIGVVANIEERNSDFWSITDIDKLQKQILADTGIKKPNLDCFIFLATYSYTPAYFFVKNINNENAGEYEYCILQDKNTVIVPWSNFTHFAKPDFSLGAGKANEIAYIGGYKAALGHQIIVDVRKKNTNELISTAVVSWINIHPVVSNIFNADHLNDFLNYITHSWVNIKKQQWQPTIVAEKLTLKSSEDNLIFCLDASITSKTQIEYEVLKNNKVYTPWKSNDFDNNFIWLKNLPHGNYRLLIRYTVQPDHISHYDFIIKPAWYQTTFIKFITGSLLAAFFALIILVPILLNQRKKAAKEIAKKAMLQVELQVIRAQLNPHFIFNALASIQSLVNKRDVAGANNYLAEFASLLRNTLIRHKQEQIPLAEEIKILETYLKLEQLRFDFKYNITVEQDINTNETEISSLLLQPLLENAIKHGFADAIENGLLELNFKKDNKNLIAVIKDNGVGFDTLQQNAGYGLKLTRNRIELLNNILSGREINMTLNSTKAKGTEIVLTFINWLDEN